MPIVTIPAVGSQGLILDQLPHELEQSAWSDAQNIRFSEGSAWRFLGDTQVFDAPTVTPYWIGGYNTTTTRYVVHAGLAAVFVDDGTTRTDITGTAPTGGIDDRWTGGSLNGVLIMNNGVDKPQYWGGNVANNLATLPNWNANHICGVMRPYRQYLVALDVTKSGTRYPHMVKWSSPAEPGTVPASWDETDPATDAGEVDLAETSDLLVDCLPLGAANIVYKERSMYAMTYIGGQYIFQFQRLPGDYGMLWRGCAAVTPMGHVVLTAGDLVLVRGTGEPESLLTGRMRRWLFSQIAADLYKRAFVVANIARTEVWVCFSGPSDTACTKALVWNWRDNVFSVRDLQNVTYGAIGQTAVSSTETWASDSGAWASDVTAWAEAGLAPSETQLFLASTAPKIVYVDSAATFAGTAFNASLERTGLSFGDPSVVKVVRGIRPRVDGVAGQTLTIQVGGAMDVEGPYTWSPAVTYTIGSSYKADTFASGRFIGIRVSSSASAAWRISSYDVDVVTRGLY